MTKEIIKQAVKATILKALKRGIKWEDRAFQTGERVVSNMGKAMKATPRPANFQENLRMRQVMLKRLDDMAFSGK